MDVDVTGSGDPLVVLHGEPVPVDSVRAIIERYEESHRVVAPVMYELEGNISEQLPQLLEMLASHDARGAPVIGHSWGVYRAFQLALTDGFEVDRIAAIGPLAVMPDDQLANYDQLADQIEAGLSAFEAALDQWFTASYLETHEIAPRVRDWFDEVGTPAVLASLRHKIRVPDLHPSLERIRIPVQLIVGEDDQATPVEWARAIHERLPNNRLHVIADSGHFPFLEAPEPTFRLLDRFLADDTA